MVTYMQKPSQKGSPKGSTLDSNEASLQAELEQENKSRKPSKALVAELEVKIARLETELALAQPDQALKMRDQLRDAHGIVRDLRYQIDQGERAFTRTIASVQRGETPQLEDLISLRDKYQNILTDLTAATPTPCASSTVPVHSAIATLPGAGEVAPTPICCEHELIIAGVIAENDQLKAYAEHEHTLRLEAEQEIERLSQEVNYRNESADRNRQLIGWMLDLFRNKSIPAACKLVLFYFHFQFFMMRPNTADETMRIGVEECAKAIGMSTSTVRSSTNKHQEHGVLNREYIPYTTDKGEKRTYVDITLNQIADTPLAIQMENNHGGARVAVCPECKEATDNYTVRYCRHCDENRWYGQPGLSNDADVSKAMEAPNYPGHEKTQKHLAFNENEQDQPQAAQLSSRIDSAIASIDATQPQEVETRFPASAAQVVTELPVEKPFRRTKKQDAFTSSAQIVEPSMAPKKQDAFDQAAPISSVREDWAMVENTPVCKTEWWLDADNQPVHAHKNGQPKQAIKKVKCGCTQQKWSSVLGVRVCAKCETPPQPYPEYPQQACPDCGAQAWSYKKSLNGFICALCHG